MSLSRRATTTFTHTGKPKHQERIERLLAQVRQEGGKVEAVVCNALDSQATAAAAADIVQRHGKLDILVANVGQNAAQPAYETTDEQWREYLHANLSSAFYGVRAALPHMLKHGFGRIMLIGSSAVYDGGGGAIDYAAGKAGLQGMMAYLAKSYARKGILTNLIHPCVIETDLLRSATAILRGGGSLSPRFRRGGLARPTTLPGWWPFWQARGAISSADRRSLSMAGEPFSSDRRWESQYDG